jgi:hypothetical protein
MKLSHELGKIFEKEMQAVIDAEINDPEYLPQEDFETCRQRAQAMVEIAAEVVVKTLALAIANHREAKHKEDHKSEIESVSIGLTSEQLEVGTRAWWLN